MTTSEMVLGILVAVLPAITAVLGSKATLATTKRKARASDRRAVATERRAKSTVLVAEMKRDSVLAPKLLAWVETVEAERDDCETRLEASDEACEARLRSVRDELISDGAIIAAQVAKLLEEKAKNEGIDPKEDTGLHKLERLVAKRPSDPAFAAVREEPRELPPAPKREPKP